MPSISCSSSRESTSVAPKLLITYNSIRIHGDQHTIASPNALSYSCTHTGDNGIKMEFMICKQLIASTVTMASWLITSECTLCQLDKIGYTML